MLRIERCRPEGTSSSEPEPSDELWCELDDELVSDETTVDPTIGMSAAAAARTIQRRPWSTVAYNQVPSRQSSCVQCSRRPQSIDWRKRTQSCRSVDSIERPRECMLMGNPRRTLGHPGRRTIRVLTRGTRGYSLEVPVGAASLCEVSPSTPNRTNGAVRCAVADCVTDRCVCRRTACAAHACYRERIGAARYTTAARRGADTPDETLDRRRRSSRPSEVSRLSTERAVCRSSSLSFLKLSLQ